jgi:hypothetical protein
VRGIDECILQIAPSLSDCARRIACSACQFIENVRWEPGAEARILKIRRGVAVLFCVAASAIPDAMPGRREPGAGLPEPGGSALQLFVPKRHRNHPSPPTPERYTQSEAPWQLRLLGKGMGADETTVSGDLPRIGLGRKLLDRSGSPSPKGRRLLEFFGRPHSVETSADPRR